MASLLISPLFLGSSALTLAGAWQNYQVIKKLLLN